MGGECEHGRQGNLAGTMGGQDRTGRKEGKKEGMAGDTDSECREREREEKKSKGREAKRECELTGLK